MKPDIYSEITARIISDLEAGVAPWAKPWNSGAGAMTMPRNHSSGRAYSGINVLILWNAMAKGGYSSNRWLTFKQAIDLGGNVRKGMKGTTIVYASSFVSVAERQKAAQDGRDAREAFMLKRSTVFNVEQCDGLTVPEIVAANDGRDRLDAADDLFAACCVAIQHGGDRAFYSPSLDFIQMPPSSAFGEIMDYYRVLAHEMVHATGHDSRLSRNILNRFGSKDYAREELVAEIGSAFVCAGLGIEYQTRHADYVGNWLAVLKEDNRAIFRAASMASKAAQWIEACAVEAVEPERELAFA